MDEDAWIVAEEDSTINPDHDQSEETEEEAQSPQRIKKQSGRKVVLNVSLTKYSVVRKVAKFFK